MRTLRTSLGSERVGGLETIAHDEHVEDADLPLSERLRTRYALNMAKARLQMSLALAAR